MVPKALPRRDPGSAIASRQNPSVPAIDAAPSQTHPRTVAAPIPAGPGPPIAIPAIGLAQMHELGRLDECESGGVKSRGAAIGVAPARPATHAASAIKVATCATPDTHLDMAFLPNGLGNHIEFGAKLQAKPFPSTFPGRSPHWGTTAGINGRGARPSVPTRKAASPAPAIRFPAPARNRACATIRLPHTSRLRCV